MHRCECIAPNVDINQSPDWAILSHINCFIQGEVHGFQILLDSLYPRSTVWGCPGDLFPFSKGEAYMHVLTIKWGVHIIKICLIMCPI